METSGLGFWRTALKVTFAPRRFFALLAGEGSRWGPLTFAIVISAVADPLSFLGNLLVLGDGAGTALSLAAVALVTSPLSTFVYVHFTAAVVHLWLRLVRGSGAPLAETRACVGYSYAPALFSIVPIVGSVVAWVWQIVVLVLGLMRVHGTTPLRAAVPVVAAPLLMVLFPLTLRAGVVEAFKIPAGSMLPTLQVDDHLFVSKLAYGPLLPGTETRLRSRLPPQYGDVIVFEYPDPDPAAAPQDFIKRVVALPGDELTVELGQPIINGWRVPRCRVGAYDLADPDGTVRGELFVEFLDDTAYLVLLEQDRYEGSQGPYRAESGEVFVLGDNRNNSFDSRAWRNGAGAGVPLGNIKGRASVIWMATQPAGAIAWGRVLQHVMGEPRLPDEAPDALHEGVERCLNERPSGPQLPPRSR